MGAQFTALRCLWPVRLAAEADRARDQAREAAAAQKEKASKSLARVSPGSPSPVPPRSASPEPSDDGDRAPSQGFVIKREVECFRSLGYDDLLEVFGRAQAELNGPSVQAVFLPQAAVMRALSSQTIFRGHDLGKAVLCFNQGQAIDFYALFAAMVCLADMHYVSKIALLFSLMDLSEEKRLEYAALSMLVRVIGVALGRASDQLAELTECADQRQYRRARRLSGATAELLNGTEDRPNPGVNMQDQYEKIATEILQTCERELDGFVDFDEWLFCCMKCERFVGLLMGLNPGNGEHSKKQSPVFDAPPDLRRESKERYEKAKRAAEEEAEDEETKKAKLRRASVQTRNTSKQNTAQVDVELARLQLEASPWANRYVVPQRGRNRLSGRLVRRTREDVIAESKAASEPKKTDLLAQVPAERPTEEAEGEPEDNEPVDAAPVKRKYWWVTHRPRQACNAVASKRELRAMQRFFRKFDNGTLANAAPTNVADRQEAAKIVRDTSDIRLRKEEVLYPLRRPGVQERLDAPGPPEITFTEFLTMVYARATPRVLVELTLWASEAEIIPIIREVFVDSKDDGTSAPQQLSLEAARVMLYSTKGDVNGSVDLADVVEWGVGDYSSVGAWISEYRTEQLLNFEESNGKEFVFKAQDLADFCNHLRVHGKAA
jgi:hypothetical protein